MIRFNAFILVSMVVLGPALVVGQTSQPPATTTIPRVIRVNGALLVPPGTSSTSVETVTFSIYADETGGAPLWQETQNVLVSGTGDYSALLGSTQADGLPLDVFTSKEARWLGIHVERPDERDQPRVLIASVPYALRAVDADTLGGKPASAYVLAEPAPAGSAPPPSPRGSAQTATATNPRLSTATMGTPGRLGVFVDSANLGDSVVAQSGARIGVGTAAPADYLHVAFSDSFGAFTGFAVQNLNGTGNAASGMLFYDQNGTLAQFQGFSNVTHEYRINNIASGGSINFLIGGSSKLLVANNGDIAMAGSIVKNGLPFLHTTGTGNVFLGPHTASTSTTGQLNAAFGDFALASGTSGSGNTAMGYQALLSNNSGAFNTAVGEHALQDNTTGVASTAVGSSALTFSTGGGNTAVGFAGLQNNTSGGNNTAVGAFAGINGTSGSNNIYLGADVSGVAGEANTMYLGKVGTQTTTFIAGVRGATTGNADAVAVMIDSAGQLGTVNSSRRYKEDIRDMGDASSGLLKLRPVTYRYKQPYADGRKPIDYGLIAEEVAQVYPDLVVRLADGEIETVQYQKINAMLLNEFQKQQAQLQRQRDELETQRAEIAALKARLDAVERDRP